LQEALATDPVSSFPRLLIFKSRFHFSINTSARLSAVIILFSLAYRFDLNYAPPMQTFECPKCGAPVTYDPNIAKSAHCPYCQSQLAVPNELRGEPARVISQINIGPQVAASASKAIWFVVLIPVVIVMIVLAGVFGTISQLRRSLTPLTGPASTRDRPDGSRTGDPANTFASVVLKFGSEGIGPGMMTDARSIAVDGNGNIYVGEYSGGRVQVFDANGNFITQWIADPKMPLRGLAVDRKGTVYVVQRGIITRYDGQTGKSLGTVAYSEGNGFDDVTTTADGGLVCAWYSGRDDIVRFDKDGKAVQTIRAAVSTPADRSELNTRVAVDGRGNVYALGSFTSGVFKFSRDGKFVNRFGSPGHQPGQLSAVNAIAVDGKGRVYVSDTKGVQVFDSDGRYLTVFNPGGVASGMVFNDKNELLIVARNKVMRFVVNQ
jgi:streptogramin lyase/DNA-directed RNA polymerase subunit RPC12/RpoP